MANRRRIPGAVAVFTIAYMLGFGGLALARGNTEFVFYWLAMAVMIAVTVWIHLRVGFSPVVLWLLAIWGMLHMAGGTVPIPPELASGEGALPVLYSLKLTPWLPKYDQATHAFGFFGATLASLEALIAAMRGRGGGVRVGVGLAAAAVLCGMGLGALNEVLEFVVTLTVQKHNVGGYENTGWDLVSNLVGAVAAGAVGLVRQVRRN